MEEFRIGFSALTKGQLYPIVELTKTTSKFHGKSVEGMKATILDGELVLTTYLPKKLVESLKDSDVTRINEAGKTDDKDNLVYYGKIQGPQTCTFVGRVHPSGTDVDAKLLKDVSTLMERYGDNKKRSNEGEDSEAKKMKVVE